MKKSTKTRRENDKSRSKAILTPGLDHVREGFVSYSEAKTPFRRLHCHDHIEVSVNEHYPVLAMFGGERILLPPNQLVVFWAALPHGPIGTTPGGWAHGIHIPLAWVLQWRLPAQLIRSLFAGRILLDHDSARPTADLEMVKNWLPLMRADTEETRRIVLLEAEARLRRLALSMSIDGSADRFAEVDAKYQSSGSLGRFEKMATLLAKHSGEPLLISDIAEAVHMQPASAMRLFRKFSGMTIHEYLLQHRIGNAQRLLSTTEMKIEDVAARSGFGSASRFYSAFQKFTGKSPAAYRRELHSR
jgi:AraC-like DNA-binding protein